MVEAGAEVTIRHIIQVIHRIQFIRATIITRTEKEDLPIQMLVAEVEAEQMQVQEQWLPQIQEQIAAREV